MIRVDGDRALELPQRLFGSAVIQQVAAVGRMWKRSVGCKLDRFGEILLVAGLMEHPCREDVEGVRIRAGMTKLFDSLVRCLSIVGQNAVE